MISHKMLGENYQRDLNNLYELYSKSFDFTGMDVVSTVYCFGQNDCTPFCFAVHKTSKSFFAI